MSDFESGATAGMAEALRFTAELGEQASGAEGKLAIVPIPNDPGRGFFLVKPNGDYEYEEFNPEPRNHALGTTDQVADYVGRILSYPQGRNPSVWYDNRCVVVLDDDSTTSRRLDRATVKLTLTPQFKKLVEICGNISTGAVPVAMRQREFIKLFQRDLRDCLPADQSTALIKALRAIDFESTTNVGSNIGRGKESMGMSIKEEIKSSAGPIPEEIMLSVPVYTDSSVHTVNQVRCLIEIDTKQMTFTLEAFAGDIDNAVSNAVAAVGNVLGSLLKDTVPIFCGCP